MAEETPAAGTGRCRLTMAGRKLEEVAAIVVCAAKAIRRAGGAEPAYRTVSAFDPAMILFGPVVKIPVGPVLHAVTQHRPDGAGITVVAICSDPRRSPAVLSSWVPVTQL